MNNAPRITAADVAKQFEKLATMSDGWYENDGTAPDPATVRRLAKGFAHQWPDDLPQPYAYPTFEGGVILEWHLKPLDPTFELAPTSLVGEWLAFDKRIPSNESDDGEAVTFDLDDEAGWETLRKRVADVAGRNEKADVASLMNRAAADPATDA